MYGKKVKTVKIKLNTPTSFLGKIAISRIDKHIAPKKLNRKKYQNSARFALPLNTT
jgi:hypothetical protein